MASPAISKAVAGIQTALIHFQAVAAGVANRATFLLPQKSKIVRIGASVRASDATDLQVMVEAGGVNLLTGAIDVIPLAAPTALTGAAGVIGGAVNLGTHSYKVTFTNAVGESAGSVKSNVVTLAAPAAITAALKAVPAAGDVDNGDHSYKVTFVNPSGESVVSAKSNVVTVADKGVNGQIELTAIPVGPAGTTARNLYRTVAGDAGAWKLVGTIADNVTATFLDNVADAALTTEAPAATGGRISLSAIPVGPAGTLSRKIYRTDAGDAGDWKLVATVADNVTTTATDNLADGAGAVVPTKDTRSEGTFFEGTLDPAVADDVAKESSITVDVDTLTGTDVKDLCVQIDMVRLD